MTQKEIQRPGLKSFKALKPEAVSIPRGEVVTAGRLDGAPSLPLVYQPALPEVDLPDWAAANLPLVREKLHEHGALLFRGFNVEAARDFERFALAVCSELYAENGEHPRTSVSGQVYTPVFYPREKHLLWHNENSFNETWPSKIIFCCLRPADAGGETPVVDSREVYRALPARVRERFVEKGVMYQRNYSGGLGLDWQTVFRTTNPEEVERRCRAGGFEFEWKDGGALRTRCVRPAAVRHPQTGEPSWFNQAQHWHVSCLDAETRRMLTGMFADEDLPRHCYYGDGTPIEDSVMEEILGVYARLEVCFPWRAGDVMLVDNVLAAHARNTFEGERRMLVAMGDMTSYTALKAAAGTGVVDAERA